MKIRMTMIYCLIVFVMAFPGCVKDTESDPRVVVVQDTLRDIEMSMNNGGEGFSLSRNCKKINEQFAAVSNSQQRLNLSIEYAKIILSVDFKGQDYRHRAHAVGLYFDYLEHCFWMMKENDVPPPRTFDFFLRDLQNTKRLASGCLLRTEKRMRALRCFAIERAAPEVWLMITSKRCPRSNGFGLRGWRLGSPKTCMMSFGCG